MDKYLERSVFNVQHNQIVEHYVQKLNGVLGCKKTNTIYYY